jgi:hypothetical protein
MTTSPEQLVVLWASQDREIALKMLFMYTQNAKLQGWWEKVTLIVWGPSAQLLTTDTELQDRIARMKKAGVRLMACKACSDQYGVSDQLTAMGIEVLHIGETFTRLLKAGVKLITL